MLYHSTLCLCPSLLSNNCFEMATPLPAFIKQNLYRLFKKRIIQIKSSISTQYKYQSLYRIMKPFFNTLRLKFESLLFIEELPFLLVNLVRVFLRFLIQEKLTFYNYLYAFLLLYCFRQFIFVSIILRIMSGSDEIKSFS